MAITTTLQQVEALYIGYFGRAGEPAGTNYWVNQISSGALSLSAVAASFSVQAEAKAAYPSFLADPTSIFNNPSTFVDAIYQNLFNRAPDADGKAYWVTQLESHKGDAAFVGKFILQVINGAFGPGGSPTDAATIDNKIVAASYFTETLFTKEISGTHVVDGKIVMTNEAAAAAKAATGPTVTSDPATIATSKAATDAFSPIGNPFPLTIGTDNFVGTAGTDTFTAADTTGGNTWTTGDKIDGAGGVDTFNITQATAITQPVLASVSNVEIVNVLSGAGATLNTTSWTGLTNLNTTTVAAVALTAAATTDVKATVVSVGATDGGVTVSGGKDVTVNATGTVDVPADAGAEIVVTGAAGKVVVTNALTGANNAVQADIAVTGGTTVTITESLGNAVNTTNTQGKVVVTGGAATTAVTVNQDKAATAGATVAGKVNGTVTIADANAASLTAAGTIATVSLNSYGASTIDSGALTTLNLAGTGGTLSVTAGALTTATVNALAMNVNGLAGGAIGLDADYTTLNLTGSTAASTIANVTAAGVKTLNVGGDAKVTLTDNTFGALESVVSTNTAGVVLGNTALGTGVSFTGGAGADSIRLSNGFTKAITMGAGDDTVTYGGAAGTGGSVNAGDGIDTIVMSGANAQAASATGVFNSKFSGFEALTVQAGAAANVNLAGINGVQTVNTSGQTGVLALSGLASGGTINLTAATGGGDVQAIVTNAAFSGNDVVNFKLTNSGGGTVNFGTVTAADVETVNISTVDAGTGVDVAASVDTAMLVATSATKIVVSGNNGLTLTNTGNVAVTSFDASGVVGNDATDTAANLAVTFASANNTAAAVVTITGGAGNDVLTGNAAKDTIVGGAGNDLIIGGKGIDTLTGGAGTDTFRFAADDSGITGTEKVTDFSIALGGDKLDLASTVRIADATGINVTGAVVGAVDVLATVKDGYITLSGADAGLVTSIGQIKAIFELLDADNVAEVGAIALNGHTYVLTDVASGVPLTADSVTDIIQLAGVTGVTGLSTTDAANNIWIM